MGEEGGLYMPDEAEPHCRTWISYVARKKIWTKSLVKGVKENLETIARTIAKYEPVIVLANPEDEAADVFAAEENITVLSQPLDDLWIRDYGAVFVVTDEGGMEAVSFNFNGWGEKQEYGLDARVAGRMASEVEVKLRKSSLVMEGGGIETDGHGTAIMTESCILNDNRNPGVSREDAEADLKELLGLDKIIWLPGIAGKEITDAHVDFYAKFVRPGVIVAAWDDDETSFDAQVTRKHFEILEAATDAKGNNFEIHLLHSPDYSKIRATGDDTAAGYINFYVGNGFVLMPEFGDSSADVAAQETVRSLYPDRVLEVINIDNIAQGGGGIHCSTMQQPA